jgi:hypothetical protein
MTTIIGHRKFRLGRSSSGLGLFASEPYRAGEHVIEYTGERISDGEADRRGGRYLFHVDAGHAIDASGREHLARYINHACRPNCEARALGGRIFIHAKRAIKSGEELTYHYGRDYFRAFIKPVGCRCTTCTRRVERGVAGAIIRPATTAPRTPPPAAPRAAGNGRRAAPARAGRAR